MDKFLILIIGPTGIGKTDFSIDLALQYNTEIISSDSRQIYKELSIGTAIPHPHQLNTVKHHLIHSLSIHDYYNTSLFEQDALKILKVIHKTKDIAVMTGGSMLYVDTFCHGIDDLPNIPTYIREQVLKHLDELGLQALTAELEHIDPIYCQEADLKNPKRVVRALEVFYTTGNPISYYRTNTHQKRDFKIIKIGLETNRDNLYNRIDQRVHQMIESGLIEEARAVYKFKNLNALNTVGYKELFDYFDNQYSLDEAIRLIKRNTRHYAKKQLTWFKKDTNTTWFDIENKEIIKEYIHNQISQNL